MCYQVVDSNKVRVLPTLLVRLCLLYSNLIQLTLCRLSLEYLREISGYTLLHGLGKLIVLLQMSVPVSNQVRVSEVILGSEN